MSLSSSSNQLTINRFSTYSINDDDYLSKLLNELNSDTVSNKYKESLINVLNDEIYRCTDYLDRCNLRRDMHTCGIYTAFVNLINENDMQLNAQIDEFLVRESDDDMRNAIDLLHTAFIRVKGTQCESKLFDLLTAIGRIPSAIQSHVWDELLQVATSIEHVAVCQKSSFRADSGRKLLCQQSTVASSLVNEASLLPLTIRRPRSQSRPSTRQLSMPISSVQRPPSPPPAPSAAYLSSRTMLRTAAVRFDSAIVKEMPTYSKSCATNTIAWRRLQHESLIDQFTVWNRNVAYGLSHEICQKLETTFERQKVVAQANKVKSTDSLSQPPTIKASGGLLSAKRAINLGIVLARFRRLTCSQIVASLIDDDKIEQLTVEDIDMLLRHYPTDEEMKICSRANADQLQREELFCNLVSRETNLKLKLELIAFQNEFDTTSRHIRLSLDTLCSAIDALLESDAFVLFLHQCLNFGNFLNQGSYAGRACGFRLDSLYDLLNAKGRNNIRLVDILAEFCDESLLPVERLIDPMAAALKCPKEHIKVQIIELQHSVDICANRLSSCNDASLRERYNKFLSMAKLRCIELMTDAEVIFANEKKLSDYFCTEKMSLIDIFTAVHSAVVLFGRAIKANDGKQKSNDDRLGKNKRVTI